MHFTLRRCSLVVGLLAFMLLGCGSEEEAVVEESSRMVYVDSKTLKSVVSRVAEEMPAVNPKTGKRTLMPALYCETCKQWRAVPPAEQVNRMPGATKCRKCNVDLTIDGPWPE